MNSVLASPDSALQPPALAAWRLSGPVLLRLSGLEWSALNCLRCPSLALRLQRLRALEAGQRRQAQHLSDTILYRAVADSGRDAAWVSLRRRVFQGQALRAAELVLIAQLPGARERRLMQRHLARQQRLQQGLQDQPLRYDRALQQARTGLQRLLAREEILAALQLSAPGLLARARSLMAKPVADWRKAERQSEATLVRYLLRAAAKTSPFGRWGLVGLADFEPAVGGLQLRSPLPHSASKSSLSLALCAQIAAAVRARFGLDGEAGWTINPTLFAEPQRWGFFVPGAHSFAQLRHARRSAAVDQIVAQMQADAVPRERGDWLQTLARIEPGRDSAALATLFDQLCQGGLLYQPPTEASDSPSPLRSLANRLAGRPGPEAAATVAALHELQALGEQWAALDLGGREAAQLRIAALARQLGPVELMQVPVIEDSYLPGVAAGLGQALRERAEQALAPLLDVLVRRDAGGLFQLLLRELFIERYGRGGRCDNIHEFAAHLQRHITAHLGGASGPSRAREVQLRKSRFMAQIGALARGRRQELCLEPAQLQAMLDDCGIAALPEPGPRSLAVHVQLLATDPAALARGEVDLVLNQVLPGFGRFFSRYAACYEEPLLTQPLRAELAALGRQLAAEPQELQATLAHNAQLHPRLTARALCAAGEYSEQAGSLDLHGLSLHHEPDTDSLVFHRAGRPVLPIYLGFFHASVLPASLRVLSDTLWLAHQPEGNRPIEHAERLLDLQRQQGLAPATDGPAPRHYARIRVGALVWQRESWVLDRAALPTAAGDEAARYAAWQELFQSHGLADQVYVRIGQRAGGYQAGDHKPIYLDMASPLGLKSLLSAIDLDAIDSLVFEEALPRAADASFDWGRGPQALELQLQLWKGLNHAWQ